MESPTSRIQCDTSTPDVSFVPLEAIHEERSIEWSDDWRARLQVAAKHLYDKQRDGSKSILCRDKKRRELRMIELAGPRFELADMPAQKHFPLSLSLVTKQALLWHEVLAEEKENREGSEDFKHFAVSFSGGGVRSSAFCCGVLWAISERSRLRHISHISAVSGGTMAASSFASFVAGNEQRHRESPEPRPNLSDAASLEKWYRSILADMIDKHQQNAGYLISFNRFWEHARDKSGFSRCLACCWSASMCSLVCFAGVLALVLVGSPLMFLVYYIAPVSMLLEGAWGGKLRRLYCQGGLNPSQLISDIASGDNKFGMLLLIAGFVLSLLGCCHCIGCTSLSQSARSSTSPAQLRRLRRHLLWRSLMHLFSRWFVLMVCLLLVTLLTHGAQELDYGFWRKWNEVQETCMPYLANDSAPLPVFTQLRCSDRGAISTMNTSAVTGGRDSDNSSVVYVSSDGDEANGGHASLFWMLAACTAALGLVSYSLTVVEIRFLWTLFKMFMVPIWLLWPMSFFLQWHVFGPITGQSLETPWIVTRATWRPAFTDTTYHWVSFMILIFAIIGIPLQGFLRRPIHDFFRGSIRSAFYYQGKDMDLKEVSKCKHVPVLIFGTTLNDFQTPEDVKAAKEPHSIFSLTQFSMGSFRTGFLKVSEHLTLSKCTMLSSAAIDGFVLTLVSRWHSRLVLALLNIGQGDWLRFDMGQNWHNLPKRFPWLKQSTSALFLIDRLPEMTIWIGIYVCMLLMDSYAIVDVDDTLGDFERACAPFERYRWLAQALLIFFIGVLSFFPHVRWLSWLQASPLIRQVHMILLDHITSRKPPLYLYLTDGGTIEDSGIVQLLRRQSRWILSTDCGDDPATRSKEGDLEHGPVWDKACDLLDLRKAIDYAKREDICSFFCPKDPRKDLDKVLQEYAEGAEAFLHIGVLYNPTSYTDEKKGRVGYIYHVRMRLLDKMDVPIQPHIDKKEVDAAQAEQLQPPSVPPLGMNGEHPSRECMLNSSSPPTMSAPRQKLGGLCCECCHSWAPGGFPDTHTVNQFFTPLMWANFCRLGRELASPAIDALFEDASRLLEFEPGETGIRYDDTGVVQEVSAGGQADKMGIKNGDRMLKVGTKSFSTDTFSRAEKCGTYFEVTFQVSSAPSLDISESR